MGCIGHENIRKGNFPFCVKNGEYAIDQEGCGEPPEEDCLVIHFCPVCGEPIE